MTGTTISGFTRRELLKVTGAGAAAPRAIRRGGRDGAVDGAPAVAAEPGRRPGTPTR